MSFLASAYTLETTYQQYLKDGTYGKARNFLPAKVAKPLVHVAELLGVTPWLDYHYAYSLGNYARKVKEGTLDWKNLDMCCKFSGSPDEVGFIMVHVYINELTQSLIQTMLNVAKGIDLGENLKSCAAIFKNINLRRKSMWEASRHERFNDFRIFLMGIKGNEDLFGEGLIYEGCFNNIP